MKTLYLIRHGKSDWSQIGQRDFDRGLNERGEKSVKKIGKFLKEEKANPDFIIASPAVRTTLTAYEIAKKVGYEKEIIYKSEIYDTHMSGFEGALSCIIEQGNQGDVMFFIGHNDAITQLAEYVSGEYFGNIPTCGLVCVDFDIDNWSDVANTKGKKRYFVKVRDL